MTFDPDTDPSLLLPGLSPGENEVALIAAGCLTPCRRCGDWRGMAISDAPWGTLCDTCTEWWVTRGEWPCAPI